MWWWFIVAMLMWCEKSKQLCGVCFWRVTENTMNLRKTFLATRNRKYITLCFTLGLLGVIYRHNMNEFRILFAQSSFEIARCSSCQYVTTTQVSNVYLDIRWPPEKTKNSTRRNTTPVCKHYTNADLGKTLKLRPVCSWCIPAHYYL